MHSGCVRFIGGRRLRDGFPEVNQHAHGLHQGREEQLSPRIELILCAPARHQKPSVAMQIACLTHCKGRLWTNHSGRQVLCKPHTLLGPRKYAHQSRGKCFRPRASVSSTPAKMSWSLPPSSKYCSWLPGGSFLHPLAYVIKKNAVAMIHATTSTCQHVQHST